MQIGVNEAFCAVKILPWRDIQPMQGFSPNKQSASQRERDTHTTKINHYNKSQQAISLPHIHTYKGRQRQLVDSPELQPVLLAADGRQGAMELSSPLVTGVIVVPLEELRLLGMHKGRVGAPFAVG